LNNSLLLFTEFKIKVKCDVMDLKDFAGIDGGEVVDVKAEILLLLPYFSRSVLYRKDLVL